MTSTRRRIVRPQQTPGPAEDQRQRQLQRLRTQLEKEQAALSRWVLRLKRSFHAFEKSQLRVVRMQRRIAQLEQ